MTAAITVILWRKLFILLVQYNTCNTNLLSNLTTLKPGEEKLDILRAIHYQSPEICCLLF